jgi:hypothetical protein
MPGLNLADDLDVLPAGLVQHLADEPVKQKVAVQGQKKGSTTAGRLEMILLSQLYIHLHQWWTVTDCSAPQQ